MKRNRIAIGTRGSKLALWQAEWIQSELKKLYPDLEIELIKIKTTGDKILDVSLAKVGGKGLFVKEIEEALLRHEVDIAVHSMKDVPTEFPEGLHLEVICKREDPRDAFILSEKLNPPMPLPDRRQAGPFSFASANPPECGKGGLEGFNRARSGGIFKSLIYKLPKGACLGTSSLRRSCQLLNIRSDLKIEQLRGNLDTRLRKLDEGQFDAIILASAGVKRLGLEHRITEILPFEISLPAIGQGAIGVECRINDEFINNLIAPLNHLETFICVKAERVFLKKLGGGCQVPIAAHARLEQRAQIIIIDGLVGSIAGDRLIKGHIEGSPVHSEQLGITLAEDVLSRGAKEILDDIYSRNIAAVNGEISS